MKNIIELTEANFEQEVLKAEGPVVVDFYAPWCEPCKMLAPLLEQLAGELAGKLKFVKLNVDDAPVLAGRYDITGVPTLMLFRGGNVVNQVVGFPEPRVLKAWLDKAVGSAVSA
jgi:thioredoxin 1